MKKTKIAIGADHGGYRLKQAITAHLVKNKFEVFDAGTYNQESCDYPIFAKRVAKLIINKKAASGILICKSGIGMSMTANRFKTIRAALCRDIKSAKLSRQHNDANILVMGSGFTKKDLAKKIINVFLKTKFEGGRHKRRVKKMETIN